jgi:uncharacterized PurR-regulated membrane protein YhhQ (DUF165 family)
VVVFAYLVAIVISNLSVMYFGPSLTMVNAFLFIGLDFTLRDKLHEMWNGKWLFVKMFALVFTGGALSWVVNSEVSFIALASTTAFVLSNATDTIVYQACNRSSRIKRVTYSNVASSIVDSITFPTIAFGAFMPQVVIGQIVAKVIGGYVWAKVLRIK